MSVYDTSRKNFHFRTCSLKFQSNFSALHKIVATTS